MPRNPCIKEFSSELDQELMADFGRYIQCVPKYIAFPSNTTDVQDIFKFAHENSLLVSIRGHAHTTGGQTLSQDGIVISTKFLSYVSEVAHDEQGNHFIEAEAGASWLKVFEACLSAEKTPPTYSDWLHLSVGGTISTGGVGQRSLRCGLQIDNVLELELIQENGNKLTCSNSQNKAFFDRARGGYGQFGIISKVKMRLEAAPKQVLVYKAIYDNATDFIQDQILLSEETSINAVQAHIVVNRKEEVERRIGQALSNENYSLLNNQSLWIFVLEISIYIYNPETLLSIKECQQEIFNRILHCRPGLIFCKNALFLNHVTRVPPILDTPLERNNPPHHHCCVFVPGARAAEFLNEILSISSYENTGNGTILVIPLKRSLLTSVHFPVPEEENFFMIAFLRRQLQEYCSIDELEEINEKTYELAQEMGGVLYPCGSGKRLQKESFWKDYFKSSTQEVIAVSEYGNCLLFSARQILCDSNSNINSFVKK